MEQETQDKQDNQQENQETLQIPESEQNQSQQDIQQQQRQQQQQEENDNNNDNQEKSEKPERIQEKVDNNELSKEELKKALKEKIKEIKINKNKLKKLEDKYVLVFKESKEIKKERQQFIDFFTAVFNSEKPELIKQIKESQIGDLDFPALQQLYQKREQKKSQAMEQIIKDITEEKSLVESTLNMKIRKLENKEDDSTNQEIVKLQNVLEEQENNNEKLSKEILELNQVIQQKDRMIQELNLKDDQRKKAQTDNLLQQLSMHNKKSNQDLNVQKRIQESEYKNTILNLQKQLEQAQEDIKEFENQVQDLKKEKNKNNDKNNLHLDKSNSLVSNPELEYQKKMKRQQQINEETQTDSIFDAQTGQFVDRVQHQNNMFNKLYGLKIQDNLPSSQKQKELQLQKQMLTHRLLEIDQEIAGTPQSVMSKSITLSPSNNGFQNFGNASTDEAVGLHENLKKLQIKENYLKNVIIKYFEYLESKQHQEASVCQNSIMNILSLNQEERAKIEQAKSKGSIWNSTLQYIPFLNNSLSKSQSQLQQNHENLTTQ